MTLQEYADLEGLSDVEIARQLSEVIGAVVPAQTVQNYRTHKRIPVLDRMRAIYEITGGWVSANDFYGLADLSA